ncbi:hypothetical protein [Psychroserpens sp. Hel_I_66]|uniref:hypothetical protein n=1 Tax=Psychroserpens sp. Hel_I_66 TaxID=1250004 RepID=UPI000646E753|nr:hypothetical protein [Psychroserpens sp. Hel_I_66]
MDANTVHTIAKALPEKEYMQLFMLMQGNVNLKRKFKKIENQVDVLTDSEAIQYLFDNVFNKR